MAEDYLEDLLLRIRGVVVVSVDGGSTLGVWVRQGYEERVTVAIEAALDKTGKPIGARHVPLEEILAGGDRV